MSQFTEFCCRNGGNNLNAGTLLGDSTVPGTSPSFAYNGTFSTNTFTVSSGAQGGSTTNPQADGVTAGMFVQVSNGAVGRIARVTSVTTSTIVLSASATVGSGTGATLANVGGAWAGPSGSTAFPFATIPAALTDSSLHTPRVNLMNAATFSITSGINHNVAGPVCFQGFSSAYGDGGRATIDGSTNAIVPLTFSSAIAHAGDLIVSNNGTTGTNAGIVFSSTRALLFRSVVHDIRGAGVSVTGASFIMSECEAYNCDSSNTTNTGAFGLTPTASANVVRSIAHDNSGANVDGFYVTTATVTFSNCIADTNGRNGIKLATGNVPQVVQQCDLYNNGAAGIEYAEASANGVIYLENSNFVKNTTWGFTISANAAHGLLYNNCFGAGTQANGSGTTNIGAASAVQEIGSINYASNVTPWVDPANGDFRITLSTAKNAGRGTFTQTASSYAGAVGYPDIGAAQHQDSASSGGITVPTINAGSQGVYIGV